MYRCQTAGKQAGIQLIRTCRSEGWPLSGVSLIQGSGSCRVRKDIVYVSSKLSLADSADRACTLASTAIDASVCVDLILSIALRDCFDGT